MRFWNLALVLLLAVGALAACGGGAAPAEDAPADDASSAKGASSAEAQGDLAQALEGDAASSGYTSEVLVVSYEGAMPASSQLALGIFRLEGTENAVTAEQLAAIAAMQLTFQDMGTWMQEQGLNLGGQPGSGGGPGAFGNLTEEERASMRATRQAGGEGGFPQGGPGAFANLSEEERASMQATAEASGMAFGNRAGARRGQLALVAEPLVELLTQLAGE